MKRTLVAPCGQDPHRYECSFGHTVVTLFCCEKRGNIGLVVTRNRVIPLHVRASGDGRTDECAYLSGRSRSTTLRVASTQFPYVRNQEKAQ